MLFFFGACCKRGHRLYYCTVVLHSSIVLPPVGHSANLQYHCCQLTDNRAVFRIFIALLRFSFDSLSYFPGHVVSLLLEFKNSVKVEIVVLYWQPLMVSHKFCCTGSQDFAFAANYEQSFFTSSLLWKEQRAKYTFASIHEEPFPFSHLYRISRIPSYFFSGPHK